MARLHVTAVARNHPSPITPTAGIPVVVSVTTDDGSPVLDLEDRPDSLSEAFDVQRLASPSSVNSRPLSPTRLKVTAIPGVYLLLLTPASVDPEDRWTRGDYLVGLTVQKGDDRGQTVFRISLGTV